MAKGQGKRAHHKRDVDQLNRTALLVGGGIAVAVLLVVIASVLF
ncbi:hypothetical protein [Anaerospora hongkongensis]|nr:hypothetical protein [Anaerospora hongkongensis]